MMKKTLAVDMDEVIADPVKKMRSWYERDYGIWLSDEQIHGKDMKEAVPPEQSYIFHEYLNTPGFFRDLDVLPGAQDVLEKLNREYDLFIVSAAMEFPNSLKDKFDWLADHFPFITWHQICLCGSKSLVQTDILVDDRIRNFSRFYGRKILFAAHHNVFVKGYEKAIGWEGVASLLL